MQKLYDAICPCCGKLNRNLILGETGGTMECDACLQVVRLRRKDIAKPRMVLEQKVFRLPLFSNC